MFELVDSQPSHLISTEAINLTPGKYLSDLIQYKTEVNVKQFTIVSCYSKYITYKLIFRVFVLMEDEKLQCRLTIL